MTLQFVLWLHKEVGPGDLWALFFPEAATLRSIIPVSSDKCGTWRGHLSPAIIAGGDPQGSPPTWPKHDLFLVPSPSSLWGTSMWPRLTSVVRYTDTDRSSEKVLIRQTPEASFSNGSWGRRRVSTKWLTPEPEGCFGFLMTLEDFTQVHSPNTLWTDQTQSTESICVAVDTIQPIGPREVAEAPTARKSPVFRCIDELDLCTALAHDYSHPTQTWFSVGCFKLRERRNQAKHIYVM